MNYLAHLHLGGPQPGDMLGSLYGDFVKGPLLGQWPSEIEAGIRLHRRIDAFTDSHPVVLQAKQRLPSKRRRYAGILIDLFFDHCLAVQWPAYASEPLDLFTARVYSVLCTEPHLPGRLATMAPIMASQDWLGSYRDFSTLEKVVNNMSRRLSRPEGLLGGALELEQFYPALMQDFHEFYPELHTFALNNRTTLP